MDSLTLFGLFAVTAMLIFYALEDRNPWFVLAFAGACALGSAYLASGELMRVTHRAPSHISTSTPSKVFLASSIASTSFLRMTTVGAPLM
jgi:hypothetical protein